MPKIPQNIPPSSLVQVATSLGLEEGRLGMDVLANCRYHSPNFWACDGILNCFPRAPCWRERGEGPPLRDGGPV